MADHMLTTSDNPYNPFTHYIQWSSWDEAAGYHTNSYLARIARVSTSLTEADLDFAYETAIDEIVNENINGMYIKVAAPEEATAA